MAVKKSELQAQLKTLENEKLASQKSIQAVEILLDETNKDAEEVTKIIEDMKLRETYVGGAMTWPLPGKNQFHRSSVCAYTPFLASTKCIQGLIFLPILEHLLWRP